MNKFKKLLVVLTLFIFSVEPIAYNASSISILNSELQSSEVVSEQTELNNSEVVSEQTELNNSEVVSEQKVKTVKAVKAAGEFTGLTNITITKGESYDLAKGVAVDGKAWSTLEDATIHLGGDVITNTNTLAVGTHNLWYKYNGTRTVRYVQVVEAPKPVVSTTKYTYHTNGKVKTKTEYHSNDKVSKKSYYNTSGKYTLVETWNKEGKRTDYKKYDGNGFKTQDFNYYSNGKIKKNISIIKQGHINTLDKI